MKMLNYQNEFEGTCARLNFNISKILNLYDNKIKK